MKKSHLLIAALACLIVGLFASGKISLSNSSAISIGPGSGKDATELFESVIPNENGNLLELSYVSDSTALKGPHDAKWSPDGNYAAIAGKYGSLAVVSVDQEGKIKIEAYKTINDDSELNDAQTVEWSSDGRHVFVGTKDHFVSYAWDGSTLSKVGVTTDDGLEQINGMYIVGDYAIAASKINYLHVIDISNPERPAIIAGYDTKEDGLIAPHDVVGWGDYIAVVDQRKDVNGKLYIYKVMDSGKPMPVVNWVLESSLHHDDMNGANRLEVLGTNLYVINNYSNTVGIVEISDPASIKLATLLDAGDTKGPSGSAPIYEGRWLIVANDDSIVIFDVENIETARIAAQYQFKFLSDSSGSGHDLSFSGNRAIGTGQADNAIFTFRLGMN